MRAETTQVDACYHSGKRGIRTLSAENKTNRQFKGANRELT
jgi:hypothetical protein